MIIVEGVDNSGKSTLVNYLASVLDCPVQGSEGPPQYEGEMNDRLARYSHLPANTIFDRHPIISQTIYGTMRSHHDAFQPEWLEWLYGEIKPTIIYCDPLERGLEGHRRNTVDTDEHLKQIETGYSLLLSHYRRWALQHAHIFYRIGDDKNRILNFLDPSTDPFADIIDFHQKFELLYNGPPRELPRELSEFREKFMLEELTEYIASDKLHDKLDALVDLVYVALGTAHLHGFWFNIAWRRVHEANMKKVRAQVSSDSKRGSTYDVVKPAGWTPPDLSDLVA